FAVLHDHRVDSITSSEESSCAPMRTLRLPLALSGLLSVGLACGSAGRDDGTRSGGSGGVITGADGAATSAASVGGRVQASSGAGGAGAKGAPYPFVLAHGFFGFDKFAGQDFLTYFYQVKDYLATKGEIVHTPAVDPFNDSTARGAELEKAIESI